MLRDVFYYGTKPNVHPREKFATSLEDARQQSTTEHFWIINEYCDYRGFDWDFDFEFLPDEDVWAEEHNNVWPSTHQKDCGTWLCPKEKSEIIIYRADVNPVKRKNEKNSNWVFLDTVDETKFDFSWHPDPTDPPYIYVWGNKWHPVELQPVLEYHTAGAVERKYMDQVLELLPSEYFVEILPINKAKFDFSWRPDPIEPPLIYVWGSKYNEASVEPVIEYRVPGATDRKYMSQPVEILPDMKNWEIISNVDTTKFDFSWRPDPRDPAYIYTWGNKYIDAQLIPTLEYHCEGATDRKYMTNDVPVLPEWKNWIVPKNVDTTKFDFTWRPDPREPAFIYEFSTQWQKTGGPRYIVEGATEIKYIDIQKAKVLPNSDNWTVPANIDTSSFDFSWHPDDTSPPYIYRFPTQWAISGGPTYTVPNASEIKYIDVITAKALPNKTNWIIPSDIDVDSFDFSWHSCVEDEPYIYYFGTQWQKTGGPKYITPGTHENSQVKYIDTRIIKATRLPNKSKFNNLGNNVAEFDYSWHPDSTEEPYIYVFGNNQYPAEIMPTIEYVVEGATKTKYVNDIVATLSENKDRWVIPDNVDTSEFDFSWVPNPHSPEYIYQFGTQWQKTGGPKYIVLGAHEVKYIDTHKAKALPNMSYWSILGDLKIKDFDYSWHPDDTEEPYIYRFGNNQYSAEIMPTIEYVVPGATQIKYTNSVVAILDTDRTNWKIIQPINEDKFDFSWIPNPNDPPYIYVFGNQWYPAVRMPTVEYIVPGATEKKYIDAFTANLSQSLTNWNIPENIDVTNFDFSWVPDPYNEPYIYEFGTQWQKTGGPKYVVEGATETKYIDLIKATRLASNNYWYNPNQSDISKFDFSWHPDETAPPYIYQFGTLLDKEDGPRYISPNTNGEIIYLERVELVTDEIPAVESFSKYVITTTLEDLIKQHPNELFWALNPDLDYSEFDFDWRPSIEQAQYVHAFGSSDSETTQTYLVNSKMWAKGFKELNWVIDKKLDNETLFKMFKKSDMFFVDRGNNESTERFEKLKQKYPNIQKTRYLNSWVDTINRCINRSTTELCWILNSELDYIDFDFKYYPNPWQMKMVHIFGTQWNHWGTTYLVNKETFTNDTKYIKVVEHLSNLNFVKQRRAKAIDILYDIVYIDHGNKDLSGIDNLIVKYDTSYLNTFRSMLDKLPVKKEHYVWIVSTICDYTNFDFTYICDPFAKEQLHVFPSDKQKFGDTFLIDVNKLRSLINDITKLEDFNKINFNQTQRVKRLSAPIIISEGDSHVSSIDTEFEFPYAVFVTEDNKNINTVDTEPMNLWSNETKNITITSKGGTRIVVPKEVKQHVKRELYDYPYISTNSKLIESNPLDIVFFSNGEACADENYKHLLNITKGLPNKVTRIDGINGRVKSQHAAATSSSTPWYFLVNAKLRVDTKFDFSWQPDRLQIPKHYIFHATNPVNGLVYGHQATVANNKKLTLANFGNGLDFTMDSEHEVVPINSGIGMYNSSEWDTWRTAFRECIKLKASNTQENKERLDIWLNVGKGEFSQYSIQGAKDAVEYYYEVGGDFDKLRLSYDWAWLESYYRSIQ